MKLFPLFLTLLLCLALPVGADEVSQIIRKAVVADRENQKIASRYIYDQRVTVEKLSKDGTVRSTKSTRFLVMPGEGVSYEVTGLKDSNESVLVAGQTYDFSDSATSTKHDKRTKPNHPRQVNTPVDSYRESLEMEDLADKYSFKLKGTGEMAGRTCHILDFEPKAKVKTRGRTEKIVAHMGGTLWIDTTDYSLVRCKAKLVKPLSIAWFFATLRELQIDYTAQKLPQGVWMPKSLDLTFKTRTFVSVSSKRQEAKMSNFRKLKVKNKSPQTANP